MDKITDAEIVDETKEPTAQEAAQAVAEEWLELKARDGYMATAGVVIGALATWAIEEFL